MKAQYLCARSLNSVTPFLMKSQIAILCFLGVAALAASQDPTFPVRCLIATFLGRTQFANFHILLQFDALKWGFAKGAIMSDVRSIVVPFAAMICPNFRVSLTPAT